MSERERLLDLGARVRPLMDRLLVKRFEFEHKLGLFVAGVTLDKGLVIAAGPGRRQRRKVRFDKAAGHLSTQGALFFEDGEELAKPRHPMRLKVGDIVEFSPRGQVPWVFENEELVWVWAKSCYGTTNDSKAEALLWQQSAGYDRKGNFLSGAENWQTDRL